MLTHEELIKKLKEWYPEYAFMKEFDFMGAMEQKLLALSKCDDLTGLEHEKVACLKQVQEYFG